LLNLDHLLPGNKPQLNKKLVLKHNATYLFGAFGWEKRARLLTCLLTLLLMIAFGAPSWKFSF